MDNFITEVDIIDESKDSFLTYTSEVLTDRAIPAAEDGLLSAQRKLLWTMEDYLKMNSKGKTKKCNAIVGSTLATSYFHGDISCYGVLCKMSQEYLMRYPLVTGQGSLGTQENNDMVASSRYTEAKPSRFTDIMMEDFKKNVVPLKETYNGEFMEPVVLPALFPNAICNGRQAIGISMSHNSLPHNLSEVCDGIVAYIKNNNLSLDELMTYIKGPDFPLENVIINSKDIKTAFATGHSSTSLKVRGIYEIKGQTITFTTIPYRTYRNKIKEQLEKNVDVFDELLDDFNDESSLGKNKLVFTVKKNINPESVVNKLFALTDLQTTLSYNMNYIVNGTPKMCSMLDLINAYVSHQINVLLAATRYDKDKAEKRAHILEGLLIVIKDIDEAIKLIKESLNTTEAKDKLIKRFNIDEIQAKAVLDMKLGKLTKLDKDELLKELEEKRLIIAECNKIINEEDYRNSKLIEKILKLKEQYGDARRTQLLNIEIPKEEKEIEEVVPEDVIVILTQSGLIKKIPASSFKVQKRNGKGVRNEDGAVLDTISTNTIDVLMAFSSKGKMYRLLVDNVPTGTRA
jgi:DNA gyrase subunit A